jgi:DeoR/GlpR family transcriptional regulator of sugar metabolism
MPFTAFSNNHGIAKKIDTSATSVELIYLGGAFNSSTYATAGNFTLEMIERINANKVFLGADGFSIRAGLTTANNDIAAIDRAMIRHTTGKVIVMSDHNKFGLVAAMEIAKPSEIDILVTNLKMSKSFHRDMKSYDIEVIIA